MASITINRLHEMSHAQFQSKVEKLATHIRRGKELKHKEEKGNHFLLALDKRKETSHSELVLADLNAVLLRSIEMGIDRTHHKQLDIIRDLSQKIIASRPIRGSLVEDFCEDALEEVLSRLIPYELSRLLTVSTYWSSIAPFAQIKAINEKRLPIKEALNGLTAKQAVEWIINNPARIHLKYADFSEMHDFNNECLQKLTENCPNLTHLILGDTGIKGDALKYLEKVPKLQKLDISWCRSLEEDALKHLAKTKELMRLDISWTEKLKPDSLKYLSKTPQLRSLHLQGCRWVERDGLKNLYHTPWLRTLNFSFCRRMEPSALKHLVHTSKLLKLDISGCSGLEADALKHLDKVQELEWLDISDCRQFEKGALSFLNALLKPKTLVMCGCDQLERGKLSAHVKISRLKSS